jgi:hypothetical protein
MKKFLTIFAASIILGASALKAEETNHDEHGASHDEHGHNNHVSLFWGATTVLETEVTAFTVGLDYEYRLSFANKLFGVGVLSDFALGEETGAVFAGFIGIHPVAGLKILVAPGLEAVFGAHGHEAFVLRGSVGYDIMINQFSITPIVSLDWVPDGNHISIVYGIATGIGF